MTAGRPSTRRDDLTLFFSRGPFYKNEGGVKRHISLQSFAAPMPGQNQEGICSTRQSGISSSCLVYLHQFKINIKVAFGGGIVQPAQKRMICMRFASLA